MEIEGKCDFIARIRMDQFSQYLVSEDFDPDCERNLCDFEWGFFEQERECIRNDCTRAKQLPDLVKM